MRLTLAFISITVSAFYYNWVVYYVSVEMDGSLRALWWQARQWWGIPGTIVAQLLIWWAYPFIWKAIPTPWIAPIIWPIFSGSWATLMILHKTGRPSWGDIIAIVGFFISIVVGGYISSRGSS